MPPVIKAILRSEDDYTREDTSELQKIYRKERKDFERETEFTHAVTAAKLERLFSKPFVKQYEGHADSVLQIEVNHDKLLSAGADGFIKIFDTVSTRPIAQAKPHNFAVGCLFLKSVIVSAGLDGSIVYSNEDLRENERIELEYEIRSLAASTGEFFAVCGNETQIFDIARQSAVFVAPSSSSVAFNPQNPFIFASVDNSFIKIYDLRTALPVQEFESVERNNSLAFNPEFPSVLTTASDDGCAYSFDLKYTKKALDRFGGETFPLLDIKYAPTGRDFACASNEGSILLYKERKIEYMQEVTDTITKAVNSEIEDDRDIGHNNFIKYRDLYHSKRMLEINSLCFNEDGRYLYSGSNEGGIRQWKTYADKNERTINQKEEFSVNTNRKLVEKFENVEMVRNIAGSHKIPAKVHAASKNASAHFQAEMRKGRKENVLEVVRSDEEENE